MSVDNPKFQRIVTYYFCFVRSHERSSEFNDMDPVNYRIPDIFNYYNGRTMRVKRRYN